MPKKDIFLGKRRGGSFGGVDAFSDYFRFMLLFECGGWWVDMDIVCLKPFDFSEPYVFAEENDKWKHPRPTSGIIKAEKGSSLLKFCCEKIKAYRDKSKIGYLEIGPDLITDAIYRFRKFHYVKSWKIFMPIGWWELNKFTEPDSNLMISESEAFSIHFWNESWRFEGYDKKAEYHPDCVYEQLKTLYLRGNKA